MIQGIRKTTKASNITLIKVGSRLIRFLISFRWFMRFWQREALTQKHWIIEVKWSPFWHSKWLHSLHHWVQRTTRHCQCKPSRWWQDQRSSKKSRVGDGTTRWQFPARFQGSLLQHCRGNTQIIPSITQKYFLLCLFVRQCVFLPASPVSSFGLLSILPASWEKLIAFLD